jgi:hypothetical protein
VNVILLTFLIINRFQSFTKTFLIVSERFKTILKRSEMFMQNAQEFWTPRNVERSKALERIKGKRSRS